MHIVRLSIKGFKTFARPLQLTLSPGLTAVVGPNGAGKSNLTEAIRWVLGEQSARRLRGGRMEELLFHGSPAAAATSMAEVTLCLGEAGEDEPRFTLTRRLYRSGEGEYLLQGLPCRLRDVEQELLGLGLSAGSPYYVGQNQVEEILRARPEERLRWLEEISGLGPFKAQRARLEADLAIAKAAMEQADRRHGELLQRLAPLQEMAGRAREAGICSREIRDLERSLLLADVATLSRSLQRQRERSGTEEQGAALLAAGRERLTIVERVLDAYREGLQDRQVHLAGRLAREAERLRYLEERLRSLGVEAERATSELHARQTEWEEQSRRLSQVGIGSQDGEDALPADLSRLLFRRNRARAEWERWESRRMGLTAAVAALGTTALAGQEDAATLAACVGVGEESRRALEAARERLTGAERAWHRGRREIATLQRERDALRQRLEEQRRRRGETMPPGPQALLEARRRGRLTGILGSVQELLEVPPTYRVAVSAALGGASHHIVVRREADAQAAIDLLKRGSLGRATLLPLDLLRPTHPPERLPDLEGLLGWAVEKVSFDAQVERAIHQVLGRVVLVTALEPAFRIARSTGLRLRIVTLDGEVIAPGGAVSGGTLPQGRGGEALRTSLAALEERLRQGRSHAATLGLAWREARRELRRQAPHWEEAVRLGRDAALRLDLAKRQHAQAGRLEDAQRQLVRAERVLSPLATALARLEGRLPASFRGLSPVRQEEAAARIGEQGLLREAVLRSGRLVEQAGERVAAAEAELGGATEERERGRHSLQQLEAAAGRVEHLARLLQGLARLLMPRQRALLEEEDRLRRRGEQGQREIARLSALLEERMAEMRRRYGDGALQEEASPLRGDEEGRLAVLRERLQQLGPINPLAEREAQQLEVEETELRGHLEDLTAAHGKVKEGMDHLASRMEQRFREGFEQVNEAFSAHFRRLFGGGQAALKREAEGVDILAAPPGKRVQRLGLLSGGERSLTALALLFAFLQVRPSPFYILDEVEAALDDVNTGRVARYLAGVSGQFLVVTHQRRTMEAAAAVYGVTMQEPGISTVVSVRLEETVLEA